MQMDEKIKKILNEKMAPEVIEIVNESYKHAGHSGDDGSGQTHFHLTIVSKKFESLSRVERNRIVMKHLSCLFDEGLHALSMTLSFPE